MRCQRMGGRWLKAPSIARRRRSPGVFAEEILFWESGNPVFVSR
jgi:hypothetical protein